MEICRRITAKRFPPGEKSAVYLMGGGKRVVMSCPYCGDGSDPKKHRGNLYVDFLFFKCYNGGCDRYVDIFTLINDYGDENMLSTDEIILADGVIQEGKTERARHAIEAGERQAALMSEKLRENLVPREEVMKGMGLVDIRKGTDSYEFLVKRLQIPDEKFAYDSAGKKIYIFNMDPSQKLVFSMQARKMNVDSGPKYLTYGLTETWRLAWHGLGSDKMIPESLEGASRFFGVLTADLESTVTVFEGPFDSFLLRNSVATCSSNIDWPFEGPHRYFQDNDEAGKSVALDKISKGIPVFLWSKFIGDHGIDASAKVKDLTDIYKYFTSRMESIPSFDSYFSDNRLDIIEISRAGDMLFGKRKDKYSNGKKNWHKDSPDRMGRS